MGQWVELTQPHLFFRSKMIQHEIDDHAGHRDIHPDRPDPVDEFFMLLVAPLEGVSDRDENKRKHHGREGNVGDENGEVKRAGPIVMGVGDRTDLEMIEEIEGEKGRRREERRHHDFFVKVLPFFFDGDKTGQKEKRGEAVQTGVDCREGVKVHKSVIMPSNKRAATPLWATATASGRWSTTFKIPNVT